MPVNIDKHILQPFSQMELLARQVVEGFITGLHKSPFHGFSVEFAEHRLYNQGDSTRHVDWKLFARTDKLFVKKYEEETNLRCQIVIDCSSSMRYPNIDIQNKDAYNKIKFSTLTAAALMVLLKRQRDAVGLSAFDKDIIYHSDAKSSDKHHKMLFHMLEKWLNDDHKNHQTNAADAIHEIADRIHKRSLVIIFSDMMDTNGANLDKLFSALQHLKHQKHEVILFHVFDQNSELEFQFENRPYRFVDLESGDEIKLQPEDVRKAYIKKIKHHQHSVKLTCGQYGIDYIPADIKGGFEQVLLPYLIKRSKMP